MAHLASLGSHAINGVAELHTELLKTNPRRFLRAVAGEVLQQDQRRDAAALDVLSNPRLTDLLSSRLGAGWIHDLEKLRRLEPMADDRRTSARNGEPSSGTTSCSSPPRIHDRLGTTTDPESMFDVLVKRLHEYKRQHLQVLHILTLHKRIAAQPECAGVPRTFIFGGKAAPGYHMAKLIIKLIHSVGDVGQRRPDGGRPAQGRIPARLQREAGPASLSRGRSLGTDFAGRQRSVRHRQHEVRHERRADHRHARRGEHRNSRRSRRRQLLPLRPHRSEVEQRKPTATIRARSTRRTAICARCSMRWPAANSPTASRPVRAAGQSLLNRDEYMLLADYQSYIDCQDRVSAAYQRPGALDAHVDSQRRPHRQVFL